MIEFKVSNNKVLMYIDQLVVGTAIFTANDSLFILKWIEIVEKYQGNGNGLKLLTYIYENLPRPTQEFQINVVNEEALSFYIKWLSQYNLSMKEINSLIKDGDIHPIVVIPSFYFSNHVNPNIISKIRNNGKL